jgi:hypothetical protein
MQRMKENEMANVDYNRNDYPAGDCCEKQACNVPSMAAYAQMVQQPQQNPQSAQDHLNQQINRQAQQAQDEVILRVKQEHSRRMEREEMETIMMIPTRSKAQGVGNVCAIKAPEPVKKKGNVALELMDALEYLLADIEGNVRRNPKLDGLDTNFAMRRATAALIAARQNYLGPGGL